MSLWKNVVGEKEQRRLQKAGGTRFWENKNTNITFENDGSSDEVEECDTQNVMKTSYMNCTVCCFHVLVKYNMYIRAYNNLGLAYKYLLTLPSTQVHIYFINYLNTLYYILIHTICVLRRLHVSEHFRHYNL